MKLYLILLWCISFVVAIPMVPIPDTEFTIDTFTDLLAESNIEGYLALEEAFYNAKLQRSKRDEATIASILNTINRSDIIFSALDLLAGYPSRIQLVANLTGDLIKSSGALASLGLNGTKILNLVNISAIINDVIKSGIVTSILDGILLDESYTPVLVNITYNLIESNEYLLYYLFHDILAKSKRELLADDVAELMKRASYGGSLGNFLTNVIAGVLSSSLVGGIASDTLYALNDTGVAVYIIKRFIATPKYLNMTGQLIKDIYDTGAINITAIYSSINLSSLISSGEKLLSSPIISNTFNDLVNEILSGDITSLFSAVGKYALAVSRIISGLEDKGLFAQLNNLIFPSSTSVLNVITTTQENKQASATMSLTSAASSSQASSSSRAGADSVNPFNSIFIYGPSILFSGLLLL